MNEQTQTIIDRARALLAAAAAGEGDVEVTCVGHNSERVEELYEASPDLLATLCDAVVDAERRAEEAEAQTAVWREHTSALVAAMKTWGSWEDGVPDASDAGECGDVGRAFNAARDALAPDMNLKDWLCSACGETAASMTSAWRWTGSIWQHTHADAPQAGHFDAVYVDPARALLDRLTAAEARVADLESVRIEQAAKLRRHLDEIAELQDRAGIAEGREAAAKANAEQMAGWLGARNAGLVQMARERDALRTEAEALRIERDVADRECDRLRAQVDADRQELTRLAEKVARLEARTAVLCDCADDGDGNEPFHNPACPDCHGAGAVIVEGAAQEGGVE